MSNKTHSEVMKELVQQKTDEISSKLGLVFVALDELYIAHQEKRYPDLTENDVNTLKELMKDINILFAVLHPDEMNEW